MTTEKDIIARAKAEINKDMVDKVDYGNIIDDGEPWSEGEMEAFEEMYLTEQLALFRDKPTRFRAKKAFLLFTAAGKQVPSDVMEKFLEEICKEVLKYEADHSDLRENDQAKELFVIFSPLTKAAKARLGDNPLPWEVDCISDRDVDYKAWAERFEVKHKDKDEDGADLKPEVLNIKASGQRVERFIKKMKKIEELKRMNNTE